jgi:hypothetical protein
MTIGNIKSFDVFIVLISCIILIFKISVSMGANIPNLKDNEKDALVYEVIPVRVIVEGYKTFYLDALYTNKKLVFVNIAALFSTLNIPCYTSQNGNNLTGFIENENLTYLIDYENGILKEGNKVVQSSPGLVKEKGVLYLESTLFTELFGIFLNFNYRALSIQLKSNFELPLIKQLRLEKMRNTLKKIKGEIPADTTFPRTYHLMKFGALDWSIASTQTENKNGNNHLAMALGTELLYGEADFSVNYYDKQKLDNRQLFYQWRWVDNDQSIIKQAQTGILSTQTISYINAPVIGFSIRNAPTTIRKATGYYYVNEYTEPNWDVELYINNALVDYTKADPSGLYHFKVPMVYGYTTLKFKFYGPMGEERSLERMMNVPYSIMPAKEFEYGFSAGIVENSATSRFARGELSYGINQHVTIGGGIEHFSSITNGATIPFLSTTIQPFSTLTLNAEYAHGVRTAAHLNYYLKKDISLDIEYTRYVRGQQATIMNAPEERKVRVSAPFNFRKMRGFARVDYTQLVYNTFKYNQANVMLSTYYKQLSLNSTTQINWINQRALNISSDLSLLYRILNGYTLRPSIQYNSYYNAFTNYKVILEKQIPKGDCSITYEKNCSSNTTIINLNFRYDLNFARTNLSASRQKTRPDHAENPGIGSTVISESAQGSIAFGRGKGYIYKSNNSSVGRGGISFYPFLDMNQNGKFDKGESMVKLSTSRITTTKIISEKDSILSIPDLIAFTWHTIEFKDSDLENPLWRFKKKRYKILIDPNQFKRVDVPIVPVFEVEEPTMEGDLVTKTDSIPITIKSTTLAKMTISSEPIAVMYALKTGDIHHLLNLDMNKKVAMVSRDTMIYLKRTMLYDVQLYTSHKPIKPEDQFTQLIARVPGIKVLETEGKDGLYHYSTGVFLNPDEAYDYFQYIREKGWIFGYVTVYSGGKRKVITFNP